MDLNTLKKLQVPVILFVKTRKGDPTFGNIKISIAKFEEMFYQRDDLTHPGKILEIIPKSDNVKIKNDLLLNITIYC